MYIIMTNVKGHDANFQIHDSLYYQWLSYYDRYTILSIQINLVEKKRFLFSKTKSDTDSNYNVYIINLLLKGPAT